MKLICSHTPFTCESYVAKWLACMNSRVTQEPVTNTIGLSQSHAHSGFLSNCAWECLAATCWGSYYYLHASKIFRDVLHVTWNPTCLMSIYFNIIELTHEHYWGVTYPVTHKFLSKAWFCLTLLIGLPYYSWVRPNKWKIINEMYVFWKAKETSCFLHSEFGTNGVLSLTNCHLMTENNK